jgi:hypothetical protein
LAAKKTMHRTSRFSVLQCGQPPGAFSWFPLKSLLTTLSLLVFAGSALAQQYEITLASQPPARAQHGTKLATSISTNTDSVTLSVAAGETATLVETRGTDYALRGDVGLFWVPVAQVPRDANVLTLSPRTREDDAVDSAIDLQRKRGDRQRRFQSVVAVLPGEWTRLYGPVETNARGTRVYSTQTQRAQDSLYIYLEPR